MDIVSVYSSVKVGISLAQFALKLLESKTDSIMADISRIHFTSAKQAFAAASTSDSHEGSIAEIRVGIGHLRDAYNALEEYSSQRTRFLLFFEQSHDMTTGAKIFAEMTDIAAMIAVAYTYLGDKGTNAPNWRETALKDLSKYLEAYSELVKKECYIEHQYWKENWGPISLGGGGQALVTERTFSQQLYDEKLNQIADTRRMMEKLLEEAPLRMLAANDKDPFLPKTPRIKE